MQQRQLKPRHVYLVANGDLRLAANQVCWPEQARMESLLSQRLLAEGWTVVRAHPFDRTKRHGFIDSQKRGLEVFRGMDPRAPVIVAESVWQYSHHILSGLFGHQGPILTVANWSGKHPGLVGLLNLNACLTKIGIPYSTLWSENFNDDFFLRGLRAWLKKGSVHHDESHVRHLSEVRLPATDAKRGRDFARVFRRERAILGVFDEGCMGMHNAIVPDELLTSAGVFKERLSQATLYAAMREVSEIDARGVYSWLKKRGVKFVLGRDEGTELTENQVIEQCRMYIAAVRLADEFGCGAIGIQYQQGLKDLVAASDLAEGLLNNVDRPPVRCPRTGRVLYKSEAIPHFNEVDECAGLDGLITYRLWKTMKFAPENTLHDLRWAERYDGPEVSGDVWVLLISGAAPPAHFVGGYRGARSERQPAMYFRKGGGTLKGVSKPGPVVWSRVFVRDGTLHCDLGVAQAVSLPREETERRWQETTPQWPIMHTLFPGISRDQMMARHKSNHIQVVYAPDEKRAHRACRVKAAALSELGLQVHLCGDVAMC